jgi:mono/diheme cytochrome c family protein
MKIRILVAAALIAVFAALSASAFQTRSVRDGVYTEEQQKRGRAQFSEKCAACHNEDLSGGEVAPALFGGNFMADWNGLTVGDLFERIRLSMPPDNPDKLNLQQRSDIIALILSANGFPTGPKELESKVEFLREIKIEPK